MNMKLTQGQLRTLIKEAIDDPNDTKFEDVSPLAHEVNLYETLGNLFAVLEEKFGKGNPEIAKWLRELVEDGVESTISDYDGQDEVMMTGFGQDDYDHSEKE